MKSLFKPKEPTNIIPTEPNNINQEDYSIIDIERNLQDWTIPNVPNHQIYKQSTFSKISFLTNYTIKTVEKTISLNNDYESLHLLTNEAITRHKEQKYSFIHIGLVQVAIKPLTRSGLNTSVLLCLRDGRHYNFHDSLL